MLTLFSYRSKLSSILNMVRLGIKFLYKQTMNFDRRNHMIISLKKFFRYLLLYFCLCAGRTEEAS